MAVSRKKRTQALNAISAAVLEILNEHVPEWNNGAPDNWDAGTREKFDLLTEVERRATRKVNDALST